MMRDGAVHDAGRADRADPAHGPSAPFTIGVGLFLTGLIGCSRMYLGVHYPTDVVAGWTAGGAWALACGAAGAAASAVAGSSIQQAARPLPAADPR